MGLYNITFTVTRDTVTPAVPQRAGVYGDKGQAIVTFVLGADLALGSECQYRVEITDGAGGYDVTELQLAQSGKVVLEIPTAWTVPGVAALRLVAVELDDDLNEETRFHSVPAFLCFDSRDDGEKVELASGPEWRRTLTKAQKAAEDAAQHAADAGESATTADAAAAAAAESRNFAEGAALTCEAFCNQVLASESAAAQSAAAAKKSEESANNAALAADGFMNNAELSAHAAAQSAETAGVNCGIADEFATAAGYYAAEASLIKSDCEGILVKVEELAGITADIKATLGVV